MASASASASITSLFLCASANFSSFVFFCLSRFPHGALQLLLSPLDLLGLDSDLLAPLYHLDLHVLLLNPLLSFGGLQLICELCLSFLCVNLDIVGCFLKFKVSFGLRDLCVVEEPGCHPLLLSDGLLDLRVPSSLGLANPGVSLDLCSPGQSQCLEVALLVPDVLESVAHHRYPHVN